jgi:hypothetical protein
MHAGGCFCGAVRYRLKGEPMFVNCCHCTQCQKITGSAFVINAVIETDLIVIEGEAPIRTDGPTEGGVHDIWRCPRCLTALWSDYRRRGWLAFLRVGTLDQPAALPPQAHIFTRSKLPWVNLSGGAPAFEIFYDMATLWPAASLARRAAGEATAQEAAG